MSMSNSPAVRSKARSAWDTKTLVSMAMLTGIAYIVMLVSKLMPSVMFLDFAFQGCGDLHRRLYLRPPGCRGHLHSGGIY